MGNVGSIRSVVCHIILRFRSFWLVTCVATVVFGVRFNFAATFLPPFAGTLIDEAPPPVEPLSNTFEVKNALYASVAAFNSSVLAASSSAPSDSVPEINEPPIWRDPTQPLQARAYDLIRRMSLSEKASQLNNTAPAIGRLGLPAYDYWSEALHGVANNGVATVFPQAIGMAATWDPDLIHQEATVTGIEGRAKYNDSAIQNNGNSRRFAGLTFWSPNINIFRDPRMGTRPGNLWRRPVFNGNTECSVHQRSAGRRPELYDGNGLCEALFGSQRP